VKLRLPQGAKAAIGSIAVVLAFIVLWHLFGRINPYESLMPSGDVTDAAPMLLNDVEIRGRSEGAPTWQVSADSLTVASDRRTLTASDLHSGVFYLNSRPAYHFYAHQLAYTASPIAGQSRIRLVGNVSAWTYGSVKQLPLALRISTSTADWNRETETATCPNAVNFLIKGIGTGSAAGMSFDQERKMVRFGTLAVVTALDTPKTTEAPTATATAPQPDSASDTEDDDTVTYGGAQGGYYDGNSRILTLPGQVWFRQGEAEVNMNGATYDRQTDTATSDSPVTITDTDTKVVGDKGTIDFATHLAILKGHVTMQVIPKPSDKVKQDEQEVKKPTTILCDQVNYDYRAKLAHTMGQVVIKQTNRTVTADDGRYNVATKIVDLEGHVIGQSTDGKTIDAPEAKISVDESDEWIQLTGPITGQFLIASTENPLDSTKKKNARREVKSSTVPPTTKPTGE
jgi:lipopolysaccharide export system protein LptA